MMPKLPDAQGHFGRFGGRFVPETLMAPLIELERAWLAAKRDRMFSSSSPFSFYRGGSGAVRVHGGAHPPGFHNGGMKRATDLDPKPASAEPSSDALDGFRVLVMRARVARILRERAQQERDQLAPSRPDERA